MHRSFLFLCSAACFLATPILASGQSVPVVHSVDWQPLAAQVRRLIEATEYLGRPFSESEKRALHAALAMTDGERAAARIQEILDPLCLVDVQINPESRVKVARGPAAPVLVEQGWRVYPVKVRNEAGVTAEMRVRSPQGSRLAGSPSNTINDRWLELEMINRQPLTKHLTGLELEYRLVQLYSRDAGKREAKLAFDVGQGTQDLGFRNEVDILFDCDPAHEVRLRVLDEDGKPATAGFEFRDRLGRVYPSQAKRLAPDFAFHPQVYRGDGDAVRLPEGTYTVEFARGPESVPQSTTIVVEPGPQEFTFQVERWIDPSDFGYWSGDHHIHAAGCAHYEQPTEGVHAPDMMLHILGEDLKVGANLTWGPCFDYQKQFFTGAVDKVSQYPYLLRYDVEVSGFGSHRSGHLCLLRLREQMYPGGESKHHWPTLCLNTLRWAKAQGALVGPAHSGWGLEVETSELPNYIVPPYSGIGANEYIVDVTHTVPGPDGKQVPAVDFISTVDTPYVWELNIWYHTLNAGFRTRISGETDFPCIYGERVGLGRSYVRLDGELDYDAWCEGIRAGRNYVGDGRSHLIDFRVNETRMGDGDSEQHLAKPASVRVSVKAAARLDPTPNRELANRSYTQKPFWHIERSRIGDSQTVPVEVLVNGEPVARTVLVADGRIEDLEWEVPIEKSSWVAVRILPSSHSNPVFVIVDDQPVRASRRSVEWCLKGVDQCWSQKERFIDADEMEQAIRDYDHARAVYHRILSEMPAE